MSAYSEVQTEFSDPELLIEALTAMGYQPTCTLGNPQPLRAYQGDYRTLDGQGHTKNPAEAMRAEIIIPRRQVGNASNDVGFIRGQDGRFKAIVSAYDSRTNWAEARSQQLAGIYAEKNVCKQAKRAGLRMTGRKVENGKVQYIFQKG